jgi:hypothetical protein
MVDIIQTYGELINKIIISMMNLVKFEDSVFLELNKYKSKKIKEVHLYKEKQNYRKTIKLFLHDIAGILSFNYIYNVILLPAITQTVELIKINIDNVGAWASIEAEIFCFESICSSKNLFIFSYIKARKH